MFHHFLQNNSAQTSVSLENARCVLSPLFMRTTFMLFSLQVTINSINSPQSLKITEAFTETNKNFFLFDFAPEEQWFQYDNRCQTQFHNTPNVGIDFNQLTAPKSFNLWRNIFFSKLRHREIALSQQALFLIFYLLFINYLLKISSICSDSICFFKKSICVSI